MKTVRTKLPAGAVYTEPATRPKTVKLGLLQHACSPNPAENLKKALTLAERAAKQGANIICTQELFRSQNFCQAENHEYFKLAEPVPNGPSTKAFQALSKKYGVVIIASLFEKRASGLYHNTAVMIDSGKILGVYRKMHIPDDPLYYEKFYFTPGDTGFR